MKRIAPLLGIILLVIVLAFVNKGVHVTAPSDNDEDSSQTSAQTDSQTNSQAQAGKTKPGAPDAGADLPPEETVGDPAKATYHILVGWTYEEDTLANMAQVQQALQMVRDAVNRSKGRVSAEIVDVDVPVEDRSPASRAVQTTGITVEGGQFSGHPVSMAGNPGSKALPSQEIGQMLIHIPGLS